MKIYVQIAEQISIQQPFSLDWMEQPIVPTEPMTTAVHPDFKPFISPAASRRYGAILKRALAVSQLALQKAGLQQVDAMITGTGLGTIESTQSFLRDLCYQGEHLLKPTQFMQSTPNTIGSLVAITTKNAGYNASYMHKNLSFPSALYDAYLQFQLGQIKTAMVGGHDGMTEDYFLMLQQMGFVGGELPITASEVAMSAILGSDASQLNAATALCELKAVKLYDQPTVETLRAQWENWQSTLDIVPQETLVMVGTVGHAAHDAAYQPALQTFLAGAPLLQYKSIFGESYSAPAMAFYAAAHILDTQKVPSAMWIGTPKNLSQIQQILLYDHSVDGDCSLILLKKICK